MVKRPKTDSLDRLAFSLKEAATLLGISRAKMQERALEGRIRTVKAGRRRLVPRWVLEDAGVFQRTRQPRSPKRPRH